MIVLETMKIFLGALFVLLVPGLAWSYILFAKKDIDWIDRFALSLGLSILLVSISVFWLNWLFDMKITLLNTAMIVSGLTILPVACILARKSTWAKNATSRLKSIFGWHYRK